MVYVDSLLGVRGRLLGIDFGEKRVGVAVSDETQYIATPLEVINVKDNEKLIRNIISFIEEFNVSAVVFGWPLNMNGTESKVCQIIKSFIVDFAKINNTPVIVWDERMSSMASEAVLISADMSRKKGRKVTDKVAATYILQGLLDYLNFKRGAIYG